MYRDFLHTEKVALDRFLQGSAFSKRSVNRRLLEAGETGACSERAAAGRSIARFKTGTRAVYRTRVEPLSPAARVFDSNVLGPSILIFP